MPHGAHAVLARFLVIGVADARKAGPGKLAGPLD
jgi:hypothetical protein